MLLKDPIVNNVMVNFTALPITNSNVTQIRGLLRLFSDDEFVDIFLGNAGYASNNQATGEAPATGTRFDLL
ncbi:hypothetical protein L0244_28125, partial [bacterium]|nr:hypothetical protein [bacterium]